MSIILNAVATAAEQKEKEKNKTQMLIWDNGFYYTLIIDDKDCRRRGKIVDPDKLKVKGEMSIVVELGDCDIKNLDELVKEATKVLEKESFKYARLKNHLGYLTLDDHRKPGEKSIKVYKNSFDNFEVKGKVLLLAEEVL